MPCTQKIQPIGLAEWRAATKAPVIASASASAPEKTVSKRGSPPSESGIVTRTSTIVTTSRIQGSRAVLDRSSRDTVTPTHIAAIVSYGPPVD